MFLLAFIICNVTIFVSLKIYSKLTCGICKCSKHLVGKVAIVTGGNAGIGFETAKDLADRGARVILACRDEGRATNAVNNIIAATGNKDVHYRQLELTSLDSVRNFVKQILETEKQLHILVNNAGMYKLKAKLTPDGMGEAMQANYFGPFLLTNLLLPLLKSSAPSRIVNVSSVAHRYSGMKFDSEDSLYKWNNNLNISPNSVYYNAKLCNILMTKELASRLKGTGVTANSLHPGVISTNLTYSAFESFSIIPFILKLFSKTVWEGAQTTIYLCVSPEVSEVSGEYYSDCRPSSSSKISRDENAAKMLWNFSEKMVKLN